MFLFGQWNFSIVYSSSIVICFPLCHLFLHSDEPLPLYFARRFHGSSLGHRPELPWSIVTLPGRKHPADRVSHVTLRNEQIILLLPQRLMFRSFDWHAVACNGR